MADFRWNFRWMFLSCRVKGSLGPSSLGCAFCAFHRFFPRLAPFWYLGLHDPQKMGSLPKIMGSLTHFQRVMETPGSPFWPIFCSYPAGASSHRFATETRPFCETRSPTRPSKSSWPPKAALKTLTPWPGEPRADR